MSIGPSNRTPKETSVMSIRAVAGSMFHTARKNPGETLFFFGLALLLVGLPSGITFPGEYYVVMAILGTIALANSSLIKEDPKKKSHAK